MIKLNEKQGKAVIHQGNALVTACPGSGKTRVLTCRIIQGLKELSSNKHRVIAMTFTNRAADEILERLNRIDIETQSLWVGTIHSFALEWIVRPYAPYSKLTQRGFTIADEFYSERVLAGLKESFNLQPYVEISTMRSRDGLGFNRDEVTNAVFMAYKKHFEERKLLDYDDILFLAYRLMMENPEIANTLSSIIRLFCLDEIQDIQDLQYAILSKIVEAAQEPPTLFLVGDSNQSIYDSLGAVTKTPEQIAKEFGLASIAHLELTGNYRSTQRIIDYYRRIRPDSADIKSLIDYSAEKGLITFHNQTIEKAKLPEFIAALINDALSAGIPPHEICVVAPHWWHIRALGKSLVQLLPEVEFDAPGISPLYATRDNFWFKVARLFLTAPEPRLYRTRFRWAKEVLVDLEVLAGVVIDKNSTGSARQLLRIVNGITSQETDGLSYLRDVFAVFMQKLEVDIQLHCHLNEASEIFFEKAIHRISLSDGTIPIDIRSFKKLFKHPAGVVISTCHGVKGEEYHTVIAFGLLTGYVPNWQVIFKDKQVAEDQASKLLYVVPSVPIIVRHLPSFNLK